MKNKIIYAIIVLAGGIFASCSTFSDDTDPYGTVEGVKDLSGAWKIESVTRNNIDITLAVHPASACRRHLSHRKLPALRGQAEWYMGH